MTATFCPYCGGWLSGVLHMSPPPPAGHYPWCSPAAGMGQGTTTTTSTMAKWLPQPKETR
jgi:hypothetical protein